MDLRVARRDLLQKRGQRIGSINSGVVLGMAIFPSDTGIWTTFGEGFFILYHLGSGSVMADHPWPTGEHARNERLRGRR
jgi:hypothetical protein